MFTFLHAADLHLDSPLRGLEQYEGAPVEEIRGATRRALENLVDLALQEQVALVVLAGDIFDRDLRDAGSCLFLFQQLDRLRETGARCAMILGNHDSGSEEMLRTLWADRGDWLHLFSSKTGEPWILDDLGVAVHGHSFGSRATAENLVSKYSPPRSGLFNLGLLHTSASGYEGHDPYAPCTVAELVNKGYDYWALGHVHQRQLLSQDPPIVFPGNTQGRHIRETSSAGESHDGAAGKGCYLVTVEGSAAPTLDFRPLDCVRWLRLRVDVSHAADAHDALDLVGRQLERATAGGEDRLLAVRVELAGATAAHSDVAAAPETFRDRVRSAALSAASGRIWVEKLKLLTQEAAEQGDSGPAAEVLEQIGRIVGDEDRLAALAKELKSLETALPHEVKEGPSAGDKLTFDNEWLSAFLPAQVQPLLASRLAGKEDDR